MLNILQRRNFDRFSCMRCDRTIIHLGNSPKRSRYCLNKSSIASAVVVLALAVLLPVVPVVILALAVVGALPTAG